MHHVMQSSRLTPRQSEVLSLLVAGQTNKEIARTLAISPFTARAHVAAVMQYFGAARRQDLPALSNPELLATQGLTPAGAVHPRVAMPPSASPLPWRLGTSIGAALFIVIAVIGARYQGSAMRPWPFAKPASAWAAAEVAPESMLLRSAAGTPGTEVRVEMIATPLLRNRGEFLRFSRAHMAAAMTGKLLHAHRFDVLRINEIDCLAYAGVSPPAKSGNAARYAHAKGYLCQHPRRPHTAIRIGAFAEGRTRDFADGETLRAVLRDLLQEAISTS
jgi:DNA-binding CsgD family transcriptional regulator